MVIILIFFRLHHTIAYRVPTNLENLELSGNFVNLEKSEKSQGILDMVREFFVTCHMIRDLLIDELIFACNV